MTQQRPTPVALGQAMAADFEESTLVKLARLERTLADERKFAVRSTRQLHRALVRELKEAEQQAAAAESRAREAEKQLAGALRRAKKAEDQLAEIKGSATWRAGRAVVAVPARLRRRGR